MRASVLLSIFSNSLSVIGSWINPAISFIVIPELIPYSHSKLPNGIDLYILHDPSQEVFRLGIEATGPGLLSCSRLCELRWRRDGKDRTAVLLIFCGPAILFSVKGYTYGIHSFNVSLPLYSYWCVATDVNREYTQATIEEVRKEIRKIQTETIPEEELSLVKNYLYGDLLRELDGVFAQSDGLKQKLLWT